MNCVPLTITLIIFFFLLAPAQARDKQGAPPKPLTADDIVAKMKFQLQLTDDQAIAVKPIIVNYLKEDKQIKLEEKKALARFLTGDQLYAWNFLQNEPPSAKKKHGL